VGQFCWAAKLNPNRRKFLAQIGRTSTAQALSRMSPERRYPILLAFLERLRQEVVDELVEQFERCLGDTYGRAARELKDLRLRNGRAADEKMVLLRDLVHIVVDPAIADRDVRAAIYRRSSAEALAAAAEECEDLSRPLDDNYFDLLAGSYGYLRQFTPELLEALDFRSYQADASLLAAVDLLRRVNGEGLRKLPTDAPIAFIPPKWRPFVIGADGQLDRHYYELCALWELRLALRAGDVWLPQSRRYADPESYLRASKSWSDSWTNVFRSSSCPTC
jgi:hypothetical protein